METQRWLRPPWRWQTGANDPNERLFRRLFRRLLLWYMSLLAVLVLGLTLSIGTTVPWMLYTSIEHDLSGRIAQLATNWQATPDRVCPLAPPASGYMLACYDTQGKLLKSWGVQHGRDQSFLEPALALTALHEGSAVQDALDETGVSKVHFTFVVLDTSRPAIVRQGLAVRDAHTHQLLGVIQLGTGSAETLARRALIVDIFWACMALGLLLGAPLGGWSLAYKALLPTRQVFQRQREFIANVSHELRTPLSLLRMNADVLLRGQAREILSTDDVALLEDILAETLYMDKLTSNMLQLAQMDSAQLHLTKLPVNLAELAQAVTRRAQALASELQISLAYQEEEAAYACGDGVLLEQATLVLLDNALKYNRPGGSVHLYTFTRDGYACLKVCDTGIGIEPQELARLGERFYRVNKARSREMGGYGLGLALARDIIAAHQGRITLESTPNQGTTAIIHVPLAQSTSR